MNKYESLVATFLLITVGFILNSFFSEAISFNNFVQFWSFLASIGTIVAVIVAVRTMNVWKKQLRATDEYKNDLVKISGIEKIQNLTLNFIDFEVPYFTDLWSGAISVDMKESTLNDDYIINNIAGSMRQFRKDFINSEFHHLKLDSIIYKNLYRSEINPFGLDESEREKFDNYSDLVKLISRLVFGNTHMYAPRGQNYKPKNMTHEGTEFTIFDIDKKLKAQLINEHKKIIDSYNYKWKLK